MTSGPELLGTRLRHLAELLEREIAAVYAQLGLAGLRPRCVAYVRLLAAGPRPIRDLADAVGVTHSAASQTVAQMARDGLVTLSPGRDARQRMVRLRPPARALLPTLDAEWAATTAAARALEKELSFPLSRLLAETVDALDRRPMRERVLDRIDRSVLPSRQR